MPTDLTYLLPLIERVSRLLLHLLDLLNAATLRFPERRRLDRTLRRLTAACAQCQTAVAEER